ncbi:trimeric intracellular cation channel family protein [Hippea sp. KM1]|uniref:trimeric intracellular cation channel family protein n=1 Tax=Hippea sp. KM1 TaxID=944481 RepID=UPI0004A82B96|nr:trimeric intracellular cation channel family protein [Hippea sp. KM1]
MDLFAVFNAIGIVAFAVSGVFKGIAKNLDILGVSILGFLTALGGGMLRDTLSNRTPAVFVGYSDVSFALLGVIIGVFIYKTLKRDISNLMIIKISDAIGLATFTVIGAVIGFDKGFNAIGVIVLATLTGTGGGALSDLLIGEIPLILREDFYASCSIIGALIFFLIMTQPIEERLAMTITLFFTLSLRLFAIAKNLSLPRL